MNELSPQAFAIVALGLRRFGQADEQCGLGDPDQRTSHLGDEGE